VKRREFITILCGAVAPSFGVEATAAGVHDAAEIERAIEAFAREPGGGLMVPPSPQTTLNSDLIIALAARYGLPAIYPFRSSGAPRRTSIVSSRAKSRPTFRCRRRPNSNW